MSNSIHSENIPFLNRTVFQHHLKYWRLAAAVLSGLMLSASFPPLKLDIFAWIGFIPLLLLPVPVSWRGRFMTGYAWGYVHAATSLLWLNEVGFAAGFLLSFYCALYPMLWYALISHLICLLHFSKQQDISEPPAPAVGFTARENCLLALAAGFLWVSLEWIRSWLFTGFPWNQLGVSQYQRIALIQIASWTGIYGLSFLIVLMNFILITEIRQLHALILRRRHCPLPWHLAVGILFFIPVYHLGKQPPCRLPAETPELLATAVQGNIPQCRFWSEEDYLLARDIYSDLSRKDFRQAPPPDLYIWPECAVPASLDYPPYRQHLDSFLKEIPVPFLIGATQNRTSPASPKDFRVFNSVFLLEDGVNMNQYYDKIHRVPFGEFVPGSRYFPQLQKWLGMGRDLTPGRNHTLFRLPKGGIAGVNICFEDVFPEISRTFTQRGANMLMTLTNDAWYNESAGSVQHLSHVVFRAVENRRPLLRSGNNSDTCLITPEGRIHNIPRDPDTGSRFFQCAVRLRIPVSDAWGTTFYTRCGNVFASACNLLSLILLGYIFSADLARKRHLYKAIHPSA